MSLLIKICGLSALETLEAAVSAGADMVGLVFFHRSPRNVTVAQAMRLADAARGRAQLVALLVDADDATLETVVTDVRPDLLQLHGSETPTRAAEIRARFGVPVMKVLKIATSADLVSLPDFAPHVDRFLFDAKPPPTFDDALPGGNGISFDWRLIAGLDAGKPSMLSGGLNAQNVAEAIRLTGTRGVDVSSGVERQPGEKDADMIKAFIAQARSAL